MKDKFSFISNAHPDFIESLYHDYQTNAAALDQGWQRFFEGYEYGLQSDGKGTAAPESILKEIKVLRLINGYRRRGHLFTRTNPVRTRRKYLPTLALENFDLNPADLAVVFEAGHEIGIGPAPLRVIIEHLEQTYCTAIGAEYMYIQVPERVKWLQSRMESSCNTPRFDTEQKRAILHQLMEAVVFENFLHTKYAGQKRFSLSGGETLIPSLHAVVEKGAELGLEEFMIGMPHRGRLNVLVNILRKTHEEIFHEFEGAVYADSVFSGDVKYHLGFTSRVNTPSGQAVFLSLAPNPSHLEAVDGPLQGMVRSKIDNKYRGDENKIAPILIHGDAAIAGQGVVYEVIQMSQLKGYRTGGTIHLVINNQVGFTTNYLDGRSSIYCTDVAKVTHSPVFHVNADDVEAVVFAVRMAIEYRQTFHTDVFIDLLGYRKYGHNESDEPRFTQPTLYKIIAAHPDPWQIYYQKLLAEQAVAPGMAEEMEQKLRELLQQRLKKAKETEKANLKSSSLKDPCDVMKRSAEPGGNHKLKTAIAEQTLLNIGRRIFSIPDDLHVFDKIRRLYESRKSRLLESRNCDWAMGEALAYATLLNEGVPVRLSGQDCERGTFSHRHAVLLVEDTEEKYVPLNHVGEFQAQFQCYNSLLSEYAVLGFEYGYACATPQGLTIWEAQFGDFANGAQIIIDNFMAGAEAKWRRLNGLVLYLPHGYEGQGPDHSTGRIERFLSLCAQDNMQAANCSTPANLFHLLRRHLKSSFRTPLIIFTPKSLLRHPQCLSPIEEFTNGAFQALIDDERARPELVRTILFCSGKLYYDLSERQQQEQRQDLAIVRLEQLYPFPHAQFEAILARYTQARNRLWVQEEPENMGAWSYLLRKLPPGTLALVSRPESATIATGFYKKHLHEQEELLGRAFSFK